MAIELGAAYISILPSTSKLAPAIREEIRKVEGEASRSGDRTGAAFGTRFKAALGRFVKGGLLAGAAGVGLLGAAGLKTAADLEQSQIGFETMLGSARKANSFLAQIKKTAAQTPFELPGLTQSAQKMLAFGFAAKDVIPTLTTLGDAASGLGIGQEGLNRIVMAVGQIQAKGKVQGEEMLQLTEAGIPAARILRNELGLTADEYEKLQKSGKLTAEKALPALLNGIKKGTSGQAGETAKFGGLMEKQSKSLSGLFSTLKDTVLVGMADAIKPLLPMLKSGLSSAIANIGPALKTAGAGLSSFVQDMKDGTGAGGQFADVATTLWGALKTTVSVGLTVTKWLANHKPLVIALVGAYAALRAITLAHAAAMKVQAGGGMLSFLTKWAMGLKPIQIATKAWAAAQWLLNIAMSANPLALIIIGLVALGAALFIAWKKSDTFRAIVTGAFNGVKAAGVAVFGWLKSAVSNTIGFVRDHWKLILGILTGPIGAAVILIVSNFDKIKGAGSAVIGWVKSIPGKLGALAGKFGNAGKSLIHAFVNGMKNAAGVIGGIAGNIWSGIKSMLNSAIRRINGALPNKIGAGKLSIDLPDNPFPQFAKGTNSAPGGMALVGEEGPELVNLPRGSQVKTASRTAALSRSLQSAASPASTISVVAALPDSLTLRVGEREFTAYVAGIAEDTYNGEDAFAGTTRRMS